ncbi:hypothetical protein J2X71_007708 [Rhizobium sp. 1399]|nr:hypothetical protein [Rhizobium sp. 1399]
MPDLFREGQGVVTEGAFETGSTVFTADTVLAKHDETYMPKEVADRLKAQGLWEEGKGPASQGEVPQGQAPQGAEAKGEAKAQEARGQEVQAQETRATP